MKGFIMFDPRAHDFDNVMLWNTHSSLFRVRESNFEGVGSKPSKGKTDEQQFVIRKDSAMLVACSRCYTNPRRGVTESALKLGQPVNHSCITIVLRQIYS